MNRTATRGRLPVAAGALVLCERVVEADPELLKWRLGMVFACAVEFLLITVAVRYLGPLVHRQLGTGGSVLWLAHHYWIALAAWGAFIGSAWWVMRFRVETAVTMVAVVIHLIALGVILGRLIAPQS